jgi:long-chain acyl-CoA synthetase
VAIDERDLVLHHLYRHARERPEAIWLTQPLGGGRVEELSFGRCLDEARRMAAHLRSLGLPPGSRIGLLSKNCAHFFLADLAIWMAGHVSVALYPTLTADLVRYILEHSGARLLFVGKLDEPAWAQMRPGIPAGLPCIAWPLAPDNGYPAWVNLVRAHQPIADEPRVQPGDVALIIYTSGSTGRPKGVVHSFASISEPTRSLVALLGLRTSDRYLSYLPLAHAMDRWLSECTSMVAGHRIYFAESVETFVADLRRARPTLFLSVPRLWLKFQRGVFAKLPERGLALLLTIPLLSGLVSRPARASTSPRCPSRTASTATAASS